MSLLISPGRLYLVSLIIALLIPLVLNGISRLMASKKIKPAYYPLTLVGLGLAGLGLFYLISPALLSSMLNAFAIFMPRGAQLATIEMQPLISFLYDNPFMLAWGNFTTSFFFSFISFGILSYLVIKQGNAEKSLLLVWSLVILAATLGQRRFAYYFAVNVALLTGYLSVLVYYITRFITDYLRGARTDYMSWQILELPDFRELIVQPVKLLARAERQRAKRAERKKTKRLEREETRLKKGGFHITISQVNMVLAVLIVFLVVFAPIVLFPSPKMAPAIVTASQARFAPSDAWCSSLSWMKENTPEPLGDPDLYYQLETSHKYRSLDWLKKNVSNPSGDPDFYYQLAERHKYPESAYGVMAWWDYGYWITRIAHRIPNANPSQATQPVTSVASFFTAQDENSANEVRQELGSAYIVIDHETAIGKFWAIVLWVGKEQAEFLETYYVLQENKLLPTTLFYPNYYRSLSSRLYNFDGKEVTPGKPWVVSYQEEARGRGPVYEYVASKVFKQITDAQQFDSYKDAEDYLSSQESANYKIVSPNPFISLVPLEALEHYRLIHSSDEAVRYSETGVVPAVKIFEYID